MKQNGKGWRYLTEVSVLTRLRTKNSNTVDEYVKSHEVLLILIQVMSLWRNTAEDSVYGAKTTSVLKSNFIYFLKYLKL
jgi:hypothetical protein